MTEIEDLKIDNARLRALLADLEWSVENTPFLECPACGGEKSEGHAPDCRLKAALEGR